jgi:hypothetical protein
VTTITTTTPTANRSRSGDNAHTVEARVLCWELRLQGYSIRQIAVLATQRLGRNLGKSRVAQLLTIEADERQAAPREAVRQYELDRLDRLLVFLEPRLRDGDPGAITTAVRLSESRRKLLGLDAPQQVTVDATVHEVTQEDLALAEMLREAKAAAATGVPA